jgi:hypothetical protein
MGYGFNVPPTAAEGKNFPSSRIRAGKMPTGAIFRAGNPAGGAMFGIFSAGEVERKLNCRHLSVILQQLQLHGVHLRASGGSFLNEAA